MIVEKLGLSMDCITVHRDTRKIGLLEVSEKNELAHRVGIVAKNVEHTSAVFSSRRADASYGCGIASITIGSKFRLLRGLPCR